MRIKDNKQAGALIIQAPACFIRLATRYLMAFILVLPYLSASGQPGNSPERETEIERWVVGVYSVKKFLRTADSLHISVSELSRYPVISPVRNPVVSSAFGMRTHPVHKVRKFHTGIDFAEAEGTPVYAAGGGVIVRKGYDPGYGNYIEIRHSGGFRSFYAHLSKTMVNRGDSVGMGERIACVGDSGTATGSHLHYEIRKGNRFLNPAGWCRCLSEILRNGKIRQ
jgi:murein DD-endopeptidase MepM/ murein hydrolase activator NlpD